MKSMQPNELLSAVSKIAGEAGLVILPFFQKDCPHQLKVDKSPVTAADIASHRFLVKTLGELSPRRPVVSEESSGEEAIIEASSGEYWLVDPLDGTKQFLKGKPEFTVNVALIRDHRPVLGVVHAPALGLTYLAENENGAWRRQEQGPPMQIRTRRAHLECLTVVASRDHSGSGVKRMLEQLGGPELTSIGSSLKFCLVAEGRADLYYRDQPTMEWDTAAAQCVVEAAGGLVLNLNGERLGYGKPGMRNPAFMTVGDPGFRWQGLVPTS